MLITKRHLSSYEPKPTVILENRLNNLSYLFNPKKDAITVFLSHKHNEDEILEQVLTLLERIGVDVYIDWLDDEMPVMTSGETASKIKRKIQESKKFILLATELAIESKWCNWELGYADSKKYPNNIAIMPIAENDKTWKGNEYLQIYPIILMENEYNEGEYFVEFNKTRTTLVQWLRQ